MQIVRKLFLKVLGLLLLSSAQVVAKDIDPTIKKRIKEGSKQFNSLLAQNAWNDRHGLSHLNQYVFGDVKWIAANNGTLENTAVAEINQLLVAYNTNKENKYTYNAVKLYFYIGGTQGFKVRKPNRNETTAQMMARLKRQNDKGRQEYEAYQKALNKEAAIMKGIRNNAPAEFRNATYNMMAGMAVYIGGYDGTIAKNEVFVLGVNGFLPSKKLSDANQIISGYLKTKTYAHRKRMVNLPKDIRPAEVKAYRAKEVKAMVATLTTELGSYHPVKRPIEVDFNVEYPQGFTITHQAKQLKALETRIPTKSQKELDGKVEVWNYTGIEAKGFAFGATKDDKLRMQFIKRIIVVVTNDQTPKTVRFDITNRRGKFEPGTDEMLFWVHYTAPNEYKADYWFSAEVEARLQQIKEQRSMKALIGRIMLKGVDVFVKNSAEVASAIYYVTHMVSQAIDGLKIPERFWNPDHSSYIKGFDWVVSIMMGDYLNTGLATRNFAFGCGLWNGAVKTVGDLVKLVEMVSGYIGEISVRAKTDASFSQLREKGVLNVIEEALGKHFDEMGKMGHKGVYLLAEDVIFVASFCVGAGELGIFARAGKLSNLATKTGRVLTKLGKLSARMQLGKFGLKFKRLVKFGKEGSSGKIEVVSKGKVVAEVRRGEEILRIRSNFATREVDDIAALRSRGDASEPMRGRLADGTETEVVLVRNRQGPNDEITHCKPNGKRTCFVAGTLILTKDGYKKIEDTRVDDWVWAYDVRTGKQVLKRVTAVFRRRATALVIIEVNGEIIYSTREHPFYVNNRWKKAKDLTAADSLQTYSGCKKAIQRIGYKDTLVNVYNFSVAEVHNYYVGKGYLVHNASGYGLESVRQALAQTGYKLDKLYAAIEDMFNKKLINNRKIDIEDFITNHFTKNYINRVNKFIKKMKKLGLTPDEAYAIYLYGTKYLYARVNNTLRHSPDIDISAYTKLVNDGLDKLPPLTDKRLFRGLEFTMDRKPIPALMDNYVKEMKALLTQKQPYITKGYSSATAKISRYFERSPVRIIIYPPKGEQFILKGKDISGLAQTVFNSTKPIRELLYRTGSKFMVESIDDITNPGTVLIILREIK